MIKIYKYPQGEDPANIFILTFLPDYYHHHPPLRCRLSFRSSPRRPIRCDDDLENVVIFSPIGSNGCTTAAASSTGQETCSFFLRLHLRGFRSYFFIWQAAEGDAIHTSWLLILSCAEDLGLTARSPLRQSWRRRRPRCFWPGVCRGGGGGRGREEERE